mgnify:CR=1 FL=1
MTSSHSRIDVVLVDLNDTPIGLAEKLEAHLQKGRLHRAFSVFIYNEMGELLIQRRALGKYHSKGLWANTCCGHPYPGEDNKTAASRRLYEELGFQAALTPRGHVRYGLKLDCGLYEHEYTHIFEAHLNRTPIFTPDPEEVCETKWIDPKDLAQDAKKNPHLYARWFRLYLLKYYDHVFGKGAPL